MVACDFFVVVTATLRTLYVLAILDMGTRRILHHNVTAHPTADWTLQQFREALAGDHPYRFVIHGRVSIFSRDLDKEVAAMGVRVLRTPARSPKANRAAPLDSLHPHCAGVKLGVPPKGKDSAPASARRIDNPSKGYNLPGWTQ
jgi:hypothetical protein